MSKRNENFEPSVEDIMISKEDQVLKEKKVNVIEEALNVLVEQEEISQQDKRVFKLMAQGLAPDACIEKGLEPESKNLKYVIQVFDTVRWAVQRIVTPKGTLLC